MHARSLTVLVLTGLIATAAWGRRESPAPPRALNDLIACRAEPDPAKRLACFDRTSAAIDRAVAADDLAVIDQQQVRATREALFGLPIPRGLTLIGAGVDTIEAVVRDASYGQDHSVTMTLESGQVWLQVDAHEMRLPKRGEKVSIHRAAFGRLEVTFDHGVVRQFKRIQ